MSLDTRSTVEAVQNGVRNPNSIDSIVLQGLDLECDVAASLAILFSNRVHRWESIEIHNCFGMMGGLITSILQSRAPAPINRLCLSTLDKGVALAMKHGLQSEKKVCISNLVIKDTKVSMTNLGHLCEGLCKNHTVKAVSFVNCSFEENAFQSVSSLSYIQKLDFASCNLKDVDLATIINILHENKNRHNLLHLNLCQNCWQDKTMTAIGGLLDPIVTPRPTLRTLNLSCPTNLVFDLKLLMKSLERNMSLKELNLREVPINNKTAECIVHCLVRNHCLETLILTDSALTVYGMDLILRNVNRFKSLKCLRLDGYQSIGLFGRKTWTKMVTNYLQTSNITLERLYLPLCFDMYRFKLNYLLDLNLGGRRLLQSEYCQKIKAPFWKFVLQRINRIHLPGSGRQSQRQQDIRRANMMYHLLRQRVLLEK